MNDNYVVVKNCLARPAHKRLSWGLVSIASGSMIMVLSAFEEHVSSYRSVLLLLYSIMLIKGMWDIVIALLQLKKVKRNKVLSAIRRGDVSAALIIQKVFNPDPTGCKYYISVSVRDGVNSVIKPDNRDFDIVFSALKSSFPNAYAQR
ncbi:MAG: hypothetical protein H6551_03970 [Chitinophagales bacterium]|nr:hypothetical protein [Chitinophagaceae bacterium]MCB9064281.1 hypothetical protein [Chitinophagales bacterium]